MSDHNKVVQITDYKVGITHQIDNLSSVLDTPYFSEINNYYCNTKKEGEPVKQHLTLNGLLERLNTIKQKTDKGNSIAILKGLYKDGTSGVYCYKDTPFLFFDIDVKEKENLMLNLAKYRIPGADFDEIMYADDTICISPDTRTINIFITEIEKVGKNTD